MKYEVRAGVLEEFSSLFPNGICVKPGGALPEGARVIQSLVLACALWGKNGIELPEEFAEDPDCRPNYHYSFNYFTHLSITEKMKIRPNPAIVYHKYYAKKMNRDDFDDIVTEFNNARNGCVCPLVDAMPRKLQSAIGFVVVNEQLDAIFEYLNFRICKNLLADRMIQVFAAGGWPCGWSGDYPGGNIIVYWPHKKEPCFK